MKALIKILLFALFALNASILFSQGAPPPPPSGHGGDTNQPAGNGAPIGSGVGILLVLGAAYGGKKVWDYRKTLEE
ncbi:MAG TPA: hypothetical protein PLC47_02100 [Bacteroidales bacterium]|jgi:hypothetical protein|nr:hypothetical protein [Bacteroidales bacterium]